MSDNSRERVDCPTAFSRWWCQRHGLPFDLWGDIEQEAWVAALTHNGDIRKVIRAMDCFRKREYRQPMPISALGVWADADALADGRPREDDMGLRHDTYHGWCHDDV